MPDAAAFPAYIERVQVPTLRHGDTVVMDDLPAHMDWAWITPTRLF